VKLINLLVMTQIGIWDHLFVREEPEASSRLYVREEPEEPEASSRLYTREEGEASSRLYVREGREFASGFSRRFLEVEEKNIYSKKLICATGERGLSPEKEPAASVMIHIYFTSAIATPLSM
jgi:hypothetical protein